MKTPRKTNEKLFSLVVLCVLLDFLPSPGFPASRDSPVRPGRSLVPTLLSGSRTTREKSEIKETQRTTRENHFSMVFLCVLIGFPLFPGLPASRYRPVRPGRSLVPSVFSGSRKTKENTKKNQGKVVFPCFSLCFP